MAHIAKGMPELDMNGRQVSRFEFWPMWLVYFPVIIQWLLLSIYYRSLTLPLIANPKLPLSGMVGTGKSDLFKTAEGQCDAAILDWFLFEKSELPVESQVTQLLENADSKNIELPFVCKPDIGCRGSGVKLIKNRAELEEYIADFPLNAGIVVQKLSDFEPEAGIFYVRMPDAKKGKIISMAMKYTPYVAGDGSQTLRELIAADPRAGKLMHLYAGRLEDKLDEVLPKGEIFRLVFSASHCRGAIFRDGRKYITEDLTRSLDAILSDLPEFYYGRLDVKFSDLESLMRGEQLQIVEINSASSEPLHIWDKDATLFASIKSLLFQYRLLFKIGAANRKRGYQPPGIMKLIKAWQHEKSLVTHYPQND